MGIVNGKITLKNPKKPGLEPVETGVLADTGALHLCIPEHICNLLQLEELEKKEVTLPDGSKKRVPYVGPVEIRFKNRTGFTGALVFGNQVLFGAIPMEDMDLVIIPSTRTLDVNPANPDTGASVAF